MGTSKRRPQGHKVLGLAFYPTNLHDGVVVIRGGQKKALHLVGQRRRLFFLLYENPGRLSVEDISLRLGIRLRCTYQHIKHLREVLDVIDLFIPFPIPQRYGCYEIRART
jgi:hypothetical protein